MNEHDMNNAISEMNGDTNNISDGYHTFGELYYHRSVLFIKLCMMIANSEAQQGRLNPVWISQLHNDGTSFNGMFVMGIWQDNNSQITYHLEEAFWNEATKMAVVLEKAPEWDGHTSDDVLKRLLSL